MKIDDGSWWPHPNPSSYEENGRDPWEVWDDQLAVWQEHHLGFWDTVRLWLRRWGR